MIRASAVKSKCELRELGGELKLRQLGGLKVELNKLEPNKVGAYHLGNRTILFAVLLKSFVDFLYRRYSLIG